MQQPVRTSEAGIDELVVQLGERLKIDPEMIVPFLDGADMLAALLEHVNDRSNRLLVVGNAPPELAMTADRADLKVTEVLGASPFISHVEDLLEVVESRSEIIYLANPNHITASNLSLRDMVKIPEMIPNGLLIIDEKYFDFYGVSGLPLLRKNRNVLIIRPLTTGLASDTAGYLVTSRGMAEELQDVCNLARISSTLHKIISNSLANESVRSKQMAVLRDESLRMVARLTGLDVQNRIASADFILLRVADSTGVKERLAHFGIDIDDLGGYQDLKHYLRYRLHSELLNDQLLDALERMPRQLYYMKDTDKRAVLFHRPEQKSETTDRTPEQQETTVMDKQDQTLADTSMLAGR